VRLLVSVRSGDEVSTALAGGADIIDAKEPSRGSLGAVSRDVLSEIVGSVPGPFPLSIALGDVTTAVQVEDLIAGLEVKPRQGPVYLKLGFASVASAETIVQLLRVAVVSASRHPTRPGIIAVAYADAARADTATAETIVAAAVKAECDGVLLDTYQKHGRGLFSFIGPAELTDWLDRARAAGLLNAVAGSLAASDIGLLSNLHPDVVGVRGAACDDGREGVLSLTRLAALRGMMPSSSAFLQTAVQAIVPGSSRNA
jgi:(5-formylfuran-3-yl)methyl phosphate synthase